MRFLSRFLSFLVLVVFCVGCESDQAIVNNVDERDANEIVVYLASKGIASQKVQAASTEIGGGSSSMSFNIYVSKEQSTESMALLNNAGLPRRKGTTLLELFAKTGLMSSEKEETVRYQAGLAEELRNTIRKIDGVLDANVQISFPATEEAGPGVETPKPTAAVYVKHQGVLEDPNGHLEMKIKRLVAGSINGLEYDSVAVISDRARFADINLEPAREAIGMKGLQDTYVSIWSMIMTKSSLMRFRLIFFSLVVFILLLLGALGWMVYRFFPQLGILKKKSDETVS